MDDHLQFVPERLITLVALIALAVIVLLKHKTLFVTIHILDHELLASRKLNIEILIVCVFPVQVYVHIMFVLL